MLSLPSGHGDSFGCTADMLQDLHPAPCATAVAVLCITSTTAGTWLCLNILHPCLPVPEPAYDCTITPC
jgi:hypothetical protein